MDCHDASDFILLERLAVDMSDRVDGSYEELEESGVIDAAFSRMLRRE
jgi:hypothetical protein